MPPGPRSALWQTGRYLRDPEGLVLDLARTFGDPFTMPTLARPLVVTGSPDGIREIFSADPDLFEPFAGESFAPILGAGSILVQFGAPHRRARRLLQPPFHGARMRAYGEAMRDAARTHLAATPLGTPFPIEDVFRAISLEVIVRTVFGVRAERVDRCGQGVLDTVAALGPLIATFSFLRRDFGGFGPWAKFRRLLDGVHDLLRQEIEARRHGGPGDDILSMLVAARDEDGAPMADQEIVEQLFTMVIAGHETTSTALAWAVDEIYRQPELVARLRDELGGARTAPGADGAAAPGRPTDGVGPDALAASPLLDAVCAETLRLHPIVPVVSRLLRRPFTLGAYNLPAGVGVGACPMLAHRRPEVFPEPERFLPERFLGGKSYAPWEYLPFGGGARRCLGAAFAQYEMKIVLGTLLLGFDVALSSPRRARTVTRAATVGPGGGVPVVRRG